jgi:DnaK suppressor protein
MDWLDRVQANTEIYEAAAMRTHFNKRRLEPRPDPSTDGERTCLDCQEPISRERIEANPQAVRCVECQIKKEKRNGDGDE